jgi:hypothetical protein
MSHRRLDGDSAGIEGDAFADEGDGSTGLAAAPAGSRARAVPFQHQKLGLPCGTLADAEQGAHAELFHLGDAQSAHLDAEPLKRLGALDQAFGIDHVGRL